jgi:Zn-dependent protease
VTPPDAPAATGLPRSCASCGAELAPSLVVCPACHALVHAAELKALAAETAQAEGAGDLAKAVDLWARMLELLPPGSLQHQRIGELLAAGRARLQPEAGKASPPTAPPRSRVRSKTGWLVGLGAVGALLLKFKWVLLFILGKGKLLVLGLLQAKTFLSMGLALWVYVMAWGWKFAVGLVVSLYIHEMGHVAWLRHYGIPASAPMFIPGVGAFVRLKAAPQSRAQDARVGMAGPLWGTAAAAFFLAVGWLAEWPMWLAIATIGAWINMFNLLPVWQLDGGRAWNALDRRERMWAAAALWLLALLAGDGLFFIIAIAGTLRVVMGRAPEKGDRPALVMYVALAAGLTLLMRVAHGGMP